MFQKILLCSDGSDRSLTAAEAAAEVAKAHNARLTLLHVCQIPSLHRPFPGAPSLAGPAIDTYVKEMHHAVLIRTLPVLEERGVRCTILEEVGNPADIIARIANQQGYDLIILGSRGVSTEKAQTLGSVCHSVIHNAACPVLVIR
jgi:nucleotide-binding universal stress UspA family protein